METVEDGRKKVQSTQAVRDGERNSMEMGEQPKRICTCGIFTDTDVHGSGINDRPLSENQ